MSSELVAPKIAVIGAGVYGLSTALRLQENGALVTVFDPVAPGERAQASYGNGGILARAAVVPVATPGLALKALPMALDPEAPLFLRWSYLPAAAPWLARFLLSGRGAEVERISKALTPLLEDAVDQHFALARMVKADGYIRRGDYVYLYKDRGAFEADRFGFDLRRARGFTWMERDRERLTLADRYLGGAYGFGVALDDHAWIEDPAAYLRAYAEAFRRIGGAIATAAVDDIAPDEHGVSVTAAGETRRFDRVVLAAGAWSAKLSRRLGVEPRLETERGYHLMLKRPSVLPPCAYMLADAKFVATPMRVDGEPALRLAGLVEIGGLDAPAADAPIALLRRRVKALYPSLTWEAEEPWLGHRPSTPDSLPLIGETPLAPRVVFAFGGQHIGLTTGPKVGRLVADIVFGRRPNIDMTPYRPDRWSRRAP